jgi:hypothetical protein
VWRDSQGKASMVLVGWAHRIHTAPRVVVVRKVRASRTEARIHRGRWGVGGRSGGGSSSMKGWRRGPGWGP